MKALILVSAITLFGAQSALGVSTLFLSLRNMERESKDDIFEARLKYGHALAIREKAAFLLGKYQDTRNAVGSKSSFEVLDAEIGLALANMAARRLFTQIEEYKIDGEVARLLAKDESHPNAIEMGKLLVQARKQQLDLTRVLLEDARQLLEKIKQRTALVERLSNDNALQHIEVKEAHINLQEAEGQVALFEEKLKENEQLLQEAEDDILKYKLM